MSLPISRMSPRSMAATAATVRSFSVTTCLASADRRKTTPLQRRAAAARCSSAIFHYLPPAVLLLSEAAGRGGAVWDRARRSGSGASSAPRSPSVCADTSRRATTPKCFAAASHWLLRRRAAPSASQASGSACGLRGRVPRLQEG